MSVTMRLNLTEQRKVVLETAKKLGWVGCRYIEKGGCVPIDLKLSFDLTPDGLIPYEKQWGISEKKGGTYPFHTNTFSARESSLTVFGDPYTRRAKSAMGWNFGWTFNPFNNWDSAGLVYMILGDDFFVRHLLEKYASQREEGA